MRTKALTMLVMLVMTLTATAQVELLFHYQNG